MFQILTPVWDSRYTINKMARYHLKNEDFYRIKEILQALKES